VLLAARNRQIERLHYALPRRKPARQQLARKFDAALSF